MNKIVKLHVEWVLTPDEIIEKAKQANTLMDEIETLEAVFQGVKKEWKLKINTVKELRQKTTLAFRLGTEPREYNCEEIINFKGGVAEYWSDGKIIRTRPLDDNERSMFSGKDDAIEVEFTNDETPKTEAPKRKQKLNKNGFPILDQAPSSEVYRK